MKRFAIACTFLPLLALTSITNAAEAVWLALPHAGNPHAQVEVLETSQDQMVLAWNTGTLQIEQDTNGVSHYTLPGMEQAVMMPDEEETAREVQISRLLRLPWGRSAHLYLAGGTATQVSAEGEILQTIDIEETPFHEEEWASVGEAGVFRDLTVAPLLLTPVKPMEDGSVWVASNLQLVLDTRTELEGVSEQAPERPVSRVFWPIYQEMITDNLDDLGTRLAQTRGTYLVITHTNYINNIQTFLNWKRQKGYTVDVHEFTSSVSFNQVRTIIQERYQSADPPLEFVLLVGDVNRGGDAAIPSGLITNPDVATENDVTDWHYARIEGNDYFPEVLIGRMTAGSSTDAFKIATRTVTYERNSSNIPLDDNHWRTSHMIGANYSEGGRTPLTPLATTELVAERFIIDWNFSNPVIYPWESTGTQATADQIVNGINSLGGLWITYRGWGNATGWVRPEFVLNDIGRLNNSFRLPVLTSFVCNTGDFGNSSHPESFGERWLVAGTPAAPKGAVAVVAPSDLHTQTAPNNSLFAGFYSSVYGKHLTNISQALLAAKFELYNNFPQDRAFGEKVEFYWHVYHVLGDPELSVWRGAPKLMTVDIPDQITLGQDYLQLAVEGTAGGLGNAHVQVIQGDEVAFGRFADSFGNVIVPLDGVTLGEPVQVTITRDNYLPQVHEIPVVQAPRFISLAGWSVDAGPDGLVSPLETVSVVVTLTNDGTESTSGITATLFAPNESLVDIVSGTATFGDLAPGAESDNGSSAFSITLLDGLPDGALIELDLQINDDNDRTWESKLFLPVGATNMQFVSSATLGGTHFQPGEGATLEFTFRNIGGLPASNLTLNILSWDEAVTVTSGEVTGVAIDAGGTATVGPFQVNVHGDTYRGRVVRFEAEFYSGDVEVDRLNFAVPLEGATTSDPLGPDAHGYFVYDDTDTEWDEAPEFTWFNLLEDPSATLYELGDDDNVTVTLPFDFTFYGRLYTAGSPITISSNGWISFKEESDYTTNFFENWAIPSSLGPTGMIAAFWDDLKWPMDAQTMKVHTRYDVSERRFIIEWSDALNRFGHGTVNYPAIFAVVLYAADIMQTITGDGVIEIHYNDIVNVDQTNNYASVGIMNRLRTIGLQYTYSNQYPAAAAPIESGRALRFTTNPPDNLIDVPDARSEQSASPDDFVLYQSYPNPFNSSTEIAFDLPEAADVRLSVFNLLGRELAVLVDRPMTAGHKQVVWQVNDLNLSSGMLLVRLQAGNKILWSKMMYVK